MAKNFVGYFADRRMNILGIASTGMPDTLRIEQDSETEEIDTGAVVFEATVNYKGKKNAMLESEFVKVGNYFLYQDEDGNAKVHTIIKTEKNRKYKEIDFYAEDAGLDLLNETALPFESKDSMTIDKYFNKYLKNSGFEIGINEIGNSLSRKLAWEGNASVTERLLSIATQFDHAEINFSFEIKGMKVQKKLVNIYKKRGISTGVTLQLNRDVDNIITSESISNLATALNVEGGTPEGKDTPITLKGYKYDDGRFYTDGIHLKDRVNNQVWSRFLSDGESAREGYITKPFSFDTLSQSELCNRAVTRLKKLSEIEQNFEVDIAVLPDNIRIGDRVRIVDQEDKLYLEARVLKFEKSRVEDSATALLGEYVIKTNGFNQRLQELADKIALIKDGSTDFLWIRYADDDKGNGFSSNPTNKKYMAIKNVLNQPVPSDNPADYSGLWVEIKGEDGIPGKAGEDGKPTYTWIRYADTVSGSGISSEPNNKKYVGFAYNKTTPTPSNIASDYAWFLAQGNDGQPGVPGKPGADGKTLYTWMKYADTETGGGMSDSGANKLYIGFAYNKTTAVESTIPTDYSWSLIKGANGGQGIPGAPGLDGKSTYTWVRYATTIIGTGMVAAPTVATKFIGIAAGMSTETPSAKPTDYTWSKFVGDNGADGKPVFFYTAYANSSNGVTDFTINKNQSAGKGYLGTYSSTNATQSTKPADYAWVELAGAFSEDIANIQKNIDAVAVPLIQPNTPHKGLPNQQWWKTDASGDVTGFYKWDGSKWAPQTIQQSILNIVELNAVNIKGSNITGTTMSASKFVTPFTNAPIVGIGIHTNKDVRVNGTLTVDFGKILIEFYVSNAAGVADYVGSTGIVEVGVGGYTARWTKANGHNLAVTQILLNGNYTAFTTDNSGNYVGGTLTPQDLMMIPESPFTANMYKTGFTQYTDSDYNQPRYSRNNRMVQLSGAIKNTIVVAASYDEVIMATLPVGVRPIRKVTQVCQGSGMNTFLLSVYQNGDIGISRYGTGTLTVVALNSWLNVSISYVAAD